MGDQNQNPTQDPMAPNTMPGQMPGQGGTPQPAPNNDGGMGVPVGGPSPVEPPVGQAPTTDQGTEETGGGTPPPAPPVPPTA